MLTVVEDPVEQIDDDNDDDDCDVKMLTAGGR